MQFVTRYFDSLVNPLFARDSQGRFVFYPYGALGRGRILPDEATAERIRRRVRVGYMLFFLILIPAMGYFGATFGAGGTRFTVMELLGFIALGGIVGLAFQLYMRSLVRGRPVSDERLTFRSTWQTQARTLGRGWLTGLLIVSILLVLSGLAALAIDPRGNLVAGLTSIVMFGLCAVLFWHQRRMANDRR